MNLSWKYMCIIYTNQNQLKLFCFYVLMSLFSKGMCKTFYIKLTIKQKQIKQNNWKYNGSWSIMQNGILSQANIGKVWTFCIQTNILR